MCGYAFFIGFVIHPNRILIVEFMFTPVARLVGHTADVIKGSFGSDRITTASADSTLKSWDIEYCQLVNTMASHCCDISDFAIKGVLTFSAAADGVRLWDSRVSVSPLVITSEKCTSLAVPNSNNLREITLSNTDGELVQIDLVGGKTRSRAKAHRQFLCNITYSEDDSSCLTSGIDGIMRQWSSSNLECLASFSTPAKNKCLFASYVGRTAVAGLFNDGSVREWHSSDRIFPDRTFKGFNVGSSCKSFTRPSSGRLIVPNADGGIDLMENGNEDVWRSVRAHSDDVSSVDSTSSPSGQLLLTCGYGLDCSAVVWREIDESVTMRRISFREVYPQIVGL